MPSSFEKKLAKYAEVIVTHGLNVQPDQVVHITSEIYHRNLVGLIAEAAYIRGAKLVTSDLLAMELARLRHRYATKKNVSYVPPYLSAKYRSFVDEACATVRILGEENPDIFADSNPGIVNAERIARYQAIKYYYEHGIEKSKVQWTLAAAATPAWAKKIFPRLSPHEGEKRLWDTIFSLCRIDSPNPLLAWKKHDQNLRTRAEKLSKLAVRELHFTGPGTDLRVGLSPKALWKGGTDVGPRGGRFEPNLPTEEVFTTPDCRLTEGIVRATRPFFVNGKLVRDLVMEFAKGELVHFHCRSGADTFERYISSDAGARRLGEVALVGIDSPVYRTGLVFQEILFDENAACHIAVGSAYRFCIDGGTTASEAALKKLGVNNSSVHTDMMISSEKVDVHATLANGKTRQLMKNGAWQKL